MTVEVSILVENSEFARIEAWIQKKSKEVFSQYVGCPDKQEEAKATITAFLKPLQDLMPAAEWKTEMSEDGSCMVVTLAGPPELLELLKEVDDEPEAPNVLWTPNHD